MSLALLCGFKAEQSIAAGIAPLTAIGWHNPGAASDLIARGATTLISFGIAGALDPVLRTGDLLLPTHVIVDGKHLPCSLDLHELLTQSFPRAETGALAYSQRIVATAAAKHALQQETDAIAADMESGLVAQAALQAGIPFAVVRTVSDTASDDLPPAALAGLAPEGDIDYMGVIASLLRHPLQFGALLRTGRQSKIAMDRLRAVAPLLKGLF